MRLAQIEVRVLEPDPFAQPDPQPQPPPPPPPPPPMCADDFQPPDKPDEEDEDPARSWRLRDLFSVSTSTGVSASGVYYVGAGGGSSVSYDWIHREASACVEYGARGGKELSVGPSYSMNFGLNLRGPGHDAPASSDKKVNITAAAGIGVDLSYTVPDNWQSAGFGTLLLGFTAAPQAGVSAGFSQVHCDDLNNNPPAPNNRRLECCSGPCNEPPGPPGNNHPDDTSSVVLFNPAQSTTERIDRWATMVRQARAVGFQALADYATYRMRLAIFDLEMAPYPDDAALDELTAAQQAVVGDYLHTRTHEGRALQDAGPRF